MDQFKCLNAHIRALEKRCPEHCIACNSTPINKIFIISYKEKDKKKVFNTHNLHLKRECLDLYLKENIKYKDEEITYWYASQGDSYAVSYLDYEGQKTHKKIYDKRPKLRDIYRLIKKEDLKMDGERGETINYVYPPKKNSIENIEADVDVNTFFYYIALIIIIIASSIYIYDRLF